MSKSKSLSYYLVCRRSGVSLESVTAGQPAGHLPGFVRWTPEYTGGEVTAELRKKFRDEAAQWLARNPAVAKDVASGWVIRAYDGKEKVQHEQQFLNKDHGIAQAEEKARAHYKKIKGMMRECTVELANVFDCLKEI